MVKFDCFFHYLSASFGYIHRVALILVQGRANIPGLHCMLSEGMLVTWPLKIKNCFMGDASGVQLKPKALFSKDLVDRRGFNLAGKRRLRVSTACWMRWPHKCERNFGSHIDNPSIKCCLNVRIDRSEIRAWCRAGGTSWCWAPAIWMEIFMPAENSLYSMYSC